LSNLLTYHNQEAKLILVFSFIKKPDPSSFVENMIKDKVSFGNLEKEDRLYFLDSFLSSQDIE